MRVDPTHSIQQSRLTLLIPLLRRCPLCRLGRGGKFHACSRCHVNGNGWYVGGVFRIWLSYGRVGNGGRDRGDARRANASRYVSENARGGVRDYVHDHALHARGVQSMPFQPS